ncbi:MAG: family 10 glycosylhydrolase, partial [Gemmatimonadaceae bacterium]
MNSRLLTALLLALTAGCAGVRGTGPAIDAAPPVVQRQMRGLWVATVANIDWPSRKGLSAAQQQAELIGILDKAKTTGFNTIVFQVRPAADALYASAIEPWASWLTGNHGENPGYDPLAFAIAETHARGMQLHAWINPFRAGNTADTAKLAATHIYNTRRGIVRVYGGNLWMDPGDPASQNRSMEVIADIVTRYDIDGIHADDYFYPYQVRDSATKQFVPFPDDSTWARYGNGMDRDDWRRANIDNFVERMYREVHAIKPTVTVGISPFGIWRPGYPASVQGLDAYASIYADSRKWLQRGWVDYFVPQLYWAIGAPQQSFPALLDWWIGENVARRHVWPGVATYRVQNNTASALSLAEIPTQIRMTRQRIREP